MTNRIFFIYFLTTTLWSLTYGCEIIDRVDGCQYTVHCIRTAGSMYTSGCDDNPNVTFVMEASNVRIINLGFFSRTNFDQRVRHFIGINNNWDAIEPNTFKYYRKSISMDLHQNRIIEISDGAFNELVMLKQLNLSNNMIVKLEDKSLQISVASQNALEVLDLSNNLLMSIGSNVFSNLVYLKTLLLHDNKIATMESSCFSVLRQLAHLTLYMNQITSLNLTLTTLSELNYLDVSRNQVSKLTAMDMLRLISLIHLNISHNVIESVAVNCFAQALSLQTLDLSYNRIATPIEKEMFNYNSNLTYVNLYQNNIKTLGDASFKSNKLSYVNIENNNLTGDLTNDTFSGLHNITSLNITNQNINVIRNNAFSEMTSLQYLNLSHNHIKVVENASFINASALIVLDLSNNFITDINFFMLFNSNLLTILMQNNNITIVPEYVLSNHSRLRELNLSLNAITKIEPRALPLLTIQILSLENNNISGTLVREVVSPAKLLKSLNLSHQSIKAINESAFIDMPLLQHLDISSNNIQYIDPNNFKGLGSVFALDLSSNNISDLNINGKLEQLSHLSLRKNMLTCIPNLLQFVNDTKLLYLDISFNNISNVTYPGFKNLINLKNLNLEQNNISFFNNEYTNKLTKLVGLYLQSNHIKEINLSYFTKLEYVNLMDNKITCLNDSQFRNLDNLIALSISSNMIKEISPGTFQHLSSLKTLILSENNITNLRFGTFRGLNETNLIDVSKNKINEINVDIFHECYRLSKLVIDYNNISSIDIERLVEVSPYLELISLGGNPIACEEIVRSTSKRFGERNIEITAMHKIFHEDNVHGIRCGVHHRIDSVDVTTEIITTVATKKLESEKGVSSVVVLVTWCSVISILLIVGLGFLYWRHRNATLSTDTRMQFNAASSRNSECYSDLLN